MADRLSDMMGAMNALAARLPPRTPEALGFVHLARCMALSGGSLRAADAVASMQYPRDADLGAFMKAAVASGTLTSAAALAPYEQLAAEFVEAARASSIVLQLTNARRIPFRTKASRIAASATAGWVAEGMPKPVSELGLGSVALEPCKAAIIVCYTEELARSSSPAADALIRADLIASINATIDGTFVSSTAAATGRPAGILNGVTAITSTGSTPAALAADLGTVAAGMQAAGSRLRSPVLLLPPELSLTVGLQTAAGPTFPRTIVSASVPADQAILVDESELLIADDQTVEISSSNQASVMMDSAPVPGTTAYTSLWQANLVAIRAERMANWAPAFSAARTAGYVDGIGG